MLFVVYKLYFFNRIAIYKFFSNIVTHFPSFVSLYGGYVFPNTYIFSVKGVVYTWIRQKNYSWTWENWFEEGFVFTSWINWSWKWHRIRNLYTWKRCYRYVKNLKRNSIFPLLSSFAKTCLVVGNAEPERGFSENKLILKGREMLN